MKGDGGFEISQQKFDDVDSESDRSHRVEQLDVLVEGEPVTLYD